MDLGVFLCLLFLTAEAKTGIFFFLPPDPMFSPSCLFLDRCRRNPNNSPSNRFRMRTGDRELKPSPVLTQRKAKNEDSSVFLWKISTLFWQAILTTVGDTAIWWEEPNQKPKHLVFVCFKAAAADPSSTSRQIPVQEAPPGDRTHPELSESLGHFPLEEIRGSS